MAQLLEPIPPGEILLEEFMRPLGIGQNQLAREIDVPVSRVAGIVKGNRAITADTALRLGLYFGTSAEMWLNLQSQYDLRVVQRTVWPTIKARITPNRETVSAMEELDTGHAEVSRASTDVVFDNAVRRRRRRKA
jgi:addiction module HigA family antidote